MGLIGKVLVLAVLVAVGFWLAPKALDGFERGEDAFDTAKSGDWSGAWEGLRGNANPVQVQAAYGQAEHQEVHALDITFAYRPDDGTLAVDEHGWVVDGAPATAALTVLRDDDGSLENGTVDPGDVWVVHVTLPQPWQPGQGSEVVWYPADRGTLTWRFTVPQTFDDGRVPLQ